MAQVDNQLDDQALQEIRTRWSRSSRGPWTSFVEGRDHTSGSSFIKTAGRDIELSGATPEDQDFIAAAYQDVPKLLEEVVRLKLALRER